MQHNENWEKQSQWNRKGFKMQARKAVFRNYSATVLVCLIFVLMGALYGTSALNIQTQPDSPGTGNIFFDLFSMDEIRDNINNADKGYFAGAWKQLLTYGTPTLEGIKFFWQGVNGKEWFNLLFASLGLGLFLFFTFFIRNMLIIGERRFFLESRSYRKTPARRVLYLFTNRTLRNPFKVMLLRDILLFLWKLTIVGWFIKAYSYRLVPYILAENPNIETEKVFRLSRALMDGNKWRWFVMDLSFLPWHILRPLTFEIAGLMYVKGYVKETEANLYAHLRTKAQHASLEGAEELNDTFLFQMQGPAMDWYPGLEYHEAKWKEARNTGRTYSLQHLMLMFFAFCILGWMWEVAFQLMRHGLLVNRGFLHGFWLPIYGFGGVFMLTFLKKFRDSVFLTFFMIMVLAGVLEYFTSWGLEVLVGMKWWNYSGYLLNLHGRICLEALVVFAVGGCALVYLLAPALDNWLQKITTSKKTIIAVLLALMFAVDVVISYQDPNTGKGVTYSQNKTEHPIATCNLTSSNHFQPLDFD